VSEDLIAAIEGLDLAGIAAGRWNPVHWFEVAATGTTTLPPAAQRSVEGLRGRGIAVDARLVAGEPFWATPEIAVVDDLVTLTAAVLGPVHE
jgi:hypothetical protein